MKETDFNVIRDAITAALYENDCELVDRIGLERSILCVMGIYLTNDICRGYGQDFVVTAADDIGLVMNKVSVVSSPNRISVITDEGMSFIQSRETICGYESLDEDIANILVIIQAVFDRIDYNNN